MCRICELGLVGKRGFVWVLGVVGLWGRGVVGGGGGGGGGEGSV